jgi:hypothetical protein
MRNSLSRTSWAGPSPSSGYASSDAFPITLEPAGISTRSRSSSGIGPAERFERPAATRVPESAPRPGAQQGESADDVIRLWAPIVVEADTISGAQPKEERRKQWLY